MFSLSTYELLLKRLDKLDQLYLRHDVDLSLSSAAKLAEWEGERSIRSTYFLLVNGEAYNLFSPSSKRSVERIIASGHSIALHFHPASGEDLEEEILSHFALLKEATGVEATAFTLHRPAALKSAGIEAGSIALPGKENWYAAPFYQEGAYISDSNHSFRVGDPLLFAERFQGRTLQLLTHPEWWIEEGEPFEKLSRLKEQEALRYDAVLKETLSFYRTV